MTTYMPSFSLPGLVFDQPAVSVLLPILLGTGVGFSTQPKETQKTHLTLKQPPLRPPPYVFAPMWTILYGCMGYAAHRAWKTGMSSLNPRTLELTQQGAILYTIQLGLNLVWMPLFFRLMRPIEASIDIITLTAVTAYLTYIWSQIDDVAGYFLLPYLGWLSFAGYLCIGAGYLNDWNFQDKLHAVPLSMNAKQTRHVDGKDD